MDSSVKSVKKGEFTVTANSFLLGAEDTRTINDFDCERAWEWETSGGNSLRSVCTAQINWIDINGIHQATVEYIFWSLHGVFTMEKHMELK